jgi:hypothetical protein
VKFTSNGDAVPRLLLHQLISRLTQFGEMRAVDDGYTLRFTDPAHVDQVTKTMTDAYAITATFV